MIHKKCGSTFVISVLARISLTVYIALVVVATRRHRRTSHSCVVKRTDALFVVLTVNLWFRHSRAHSIITSPMGGVRPACLYACLSERILKKPHVQTSRDVLYVLRAAAVGPVDCRDVKCQCFVIVWRRFAVYCRITITLY